MKLNRNSYLLYWRGVGFIHKNICASVLCIIYAELSIKHYESFTIRTRSQLFVDEYKNKIERSSTMPILCVAIYVVL